MKLTEPQWKILEGLLPKPTIREDKRGRPWRDPRDVLSGVLWVLQCGARWKDLPDNYPPYQTCHRRFQQWVNDGVMEKILRIVGEDLRKRGGLDLTDTYIDGTFAPAKKGAKKSVKPSVGRVPRSWQLETARVFLSPLGLKVLAHMKYDLLKQHTKADLSEQSLRELSVIKPTTVINLMNSFGNTTVFNSLLLIREIANVNGRKTEEHSGATVDDGE
jgi:transposase